MANKLSSGEAIQIFGIVVAIGASKHYSIELDYDTEWSKMWLRLWYSPKPQVVEKAGYADSENYSFAEIIHMLKEWTAIVVKDRGGEP